MKELFKKALAEVVGTFVLVFVACGVAALTGGQLVATSLAFGLVIVGMAYSVGRVSGCHINPAVSLAVLITGKMTFKEFLVYVCSQVLGAIAGGLLIFGIVKMGGIDLNSIGDACNYAIRSNAITGIYPTGAMIVASVLTEVVLTCIFVFVILNVTDDNNTAGKKGGLVIGLTLTLVHLLGIGLTGTSVNPARSIGTAVAAFIFNGTTNALGQLWIFVVAPLAGAALAALLYKTLNVKKSA